MSGLAIRLMREAADEIDRLTARVAELEGALAEIERLRGLVTVLLDNDPDDMAADGITVLDVWRKDARTVLSGGGAKLEAKS